MSEVTEMRRELGEKAARKGEPLHDGASQEFTEAYRRGSLGFGSNVAPKNFGKDIAKPDVWYCICGFANKTNRRYMRAGELACWQCGTAKSYGEDKDREQEG